MRTLLFISLFSFLESYAGPKLLDRTIYRHTISVTEIEDQEDKEKEEEMVSIIEIKLKTIY